MRWGPIAVVLVGCVHVELAAPPEGATSEARIDAYARLRPGPVQERWSRHHIVLMDSHVVLADGTRVDLASDLEPVVAPGSDTARLADESHAARSRSRWWFAATVASAIAMLGGGFLGVAETRSAAHALELAGAIELVAIPLYVVSAVHYERNRREAIEAQHAAFAHYDGDLRARLGVCADGLRLVDCAPPR